MRLTLSNLLTLLGVVLAQVFRATLIFGNGIIANQLGFRQKIDKKNAYRHQVDKRFFSSRLNNNNLES